MAQGKFQSDRVLAHQAVAPKNAKRHEHDVKNTHRWHEYQIDGVPQRECTIKVCGSIETWCSSLGEWI